MEQKISTTTNSILLLLVPFLLSLGIAALFYPGFMSYDTLHALHEARDGVTDSMWPPMVSYIWRAVDVVSLNPSAMHFSQTFVLLFSIFAIVYSFTKKTIYATFFLLIYLTIPVILGSIAVIWKDVLMAAFFLAGFAVITYMSRRKKKSEIIALSILTTILLFLGICSRHNGITAAVPLYFYLALVICSKYHKPILRFWGGVFLLGAVLTGVSFIAKVQMDHYSLPSFDRLPSSTNFFIRSVRVLDIAGASLCLDINLLDKIAPSTSLEEIRKDYDPRHINLSKRLLDRVPLDHRIDKLWWAVALHHPLCFLSNKFQLTKYLIGANSGPQFIITQPSIDPNEYGYSLPKSKLRDSVVGYIVNASQFWFFRPWFLYLISFICLIYLIVKRALTSGSITIFLSSIFYMGSLVIFGNAADARLPFYTTTGLLIFTFISLLGIRGKVIPRRERDVL